MTPSGADEPPQYKGWVWSAGNEPSEKLPFRIPRANTCRNPVDDLEVAKAKCKAWVKKKLEEARAASVQKPALAATSTSQTSEV